MNSLPVLKPGDFVELIAPASRCSDHELLSIKQLCESWQLNCIVSEDIFGSDLLCANSDAARFNHLKNALQNPQTKAVICARGGYGAMRLIPQLANIQPPTTPKIFVGMSDTTCLQLYLQQQWGWATIHGAASPDKFSAASIASLKALLFATTEVVEFTQLKPLNQAATEQRVLSSTVTGGNLTLVQAGIGTNWQLEARNKLVLLEEVGERGYRVDRMLTHLQQAHLLDGAAAILLGDFLGGNEPDGTSLIPAVVQRFAEACALPVVQIAGIGHGATNFPIPCATSARLQLGNELQLSCFR